MGILSFADIVSPTSQITSGVLMTFLTEARAFFHSQPVLMEISGEVSVLGDTHGQFQDTKTAILKTGAMASFDSPEAIKPIVFLGDYVDRGPDSLRTFLGPLALAMHNPGKVVALAGNHERPIYPYSNKACLVSEVAKLFGPHSQDLLQMFRDVANELPACAVVNKSTFCVHGGPPLQWGLDDLARATKTTMTDDSNKEAVSMLWSDPATPMQEEILAANNVSAAFNSPRGAGILFGKAFLADFLQANGLSHMLRGHQCISLDGPVDHWGLATTVFTAADYGGSGSMGGVAIEREEGRRFETWRAGDRL
ncbi:Calcineurin-like phosphoesterase [Carpediemonas membranifera]|uniref:Calcineurin-like phosphoesterase n=1 Tax=Carpediemonas membranifera TaxID=201153 RepID=A0A8J6AV36_9EUKA|nr:Calcineurin-like phosphoesterase [Carpediemonas membranifera]|eukprot:KAG9395521.1 Calcineurin-like phosphoesterase [Carpediemonas membranifera]